MAKQTDKAQPKHQTHTAECEKLAAEYQEGLTRLAEVRVALDRSWYQSLADLSLSREQLQWHRETPPSEMPDAKNLVNRLSATWRSQFPDAAPVEDFDRQIQQRLERLARFAASEEARPRRFRPEVEAALSAFEGAWQWLIGISADLSDLQRRQLRYENEVAAGREGLSGYPDPSKLEEFEAERKQVMRKAEDGNRSLHDARGRITGVLNAELSGRKSGMQKIHLPESPGGLRTMLRHYGLGLDGPGPGPRQRREDQAADGAMKDWANRLRQQREAQTVAGS